MIYNTLHLLLFISVCYAQQIKSDIVGLTDIEDPFKPKKSCSLITSTFCQDIEYNVTMFPNMFGHTSQEDATYIVNQFFPLVKVKCSKTLKLFICSLYFPVCNKYNTLLKPCKSLCLENRKGCEPLMRKFNFQWPQQMDCNNFVEDPMCIRQNNSGPDPAVSTSAPRGFVFTCPSWLRVPPSQDYSVVVEGREEKNCGLPCDQYFFSSDDSRRFARMWIFMWALLCAASTLATVLTFLIDMSRFRYPERPIIFLSGCYFIVALVYIVGFFLQNEVACSGPFKQNIAPALEGDAAAVYRPKIITQGTKREGCTILFMLLYFFTMASQIWWVILCLTWYLAAGQHWVHEAIALNSQYFHFVAWSIPAAKTIGILAWGKVDGDPLSGVCFTGLNNNTALVGFLIVPMCVYLLLGTGFLIAGFISLFEIRTIIKTGGTKTDKLEKLIMRIGVFSVLYLLPALVVVACYFYEYRKKATWMRSWHNQVCRNRQLPQFGCPEQSYDPKNNEMPIFELFMIKYLMIFIVGITSGFWVWSGKTLLSWNIFCSNICCWRSSQSAAAAANAAAGANPAGGPLMAAGMAGPSQKGGMRGAGSGSGTSGSMKGPGPSRSLFDAPPGASGNPTARGYHHVPVNDPKLAAAGPGAAPMPLQWAGPGTTSPGMLKTIGGAQGLSMV